MHDAEARAKGEREIIHPVARVRLTTTALDDAGERSVLLYRGLQGWSLVGDRLRAVEDHRCVRSDEKGASERDAGGTREGQDDD